MPQTFRAGVVGTGYVSHHHIRAIRDLPFVQLVGVADQNATLAKTVAEKYGVAAFDCLSAMKAASPDVIHVLTPPASHKALTCLLYTSPSPRDS